MIPPEAITILATIGLTQDQAVQVASVVRMVEDATRAEYEAVAQGQRAANAARQARWRERHGVTSRNVTETLCNVTNVTDPHARGLPGSDPSDPPVSSPPVDPNGSTAPKGRERGFRLPADWQPNDQHRAEGKTLGLTDSEFLRIVEEFRNYWDAIPGVKGRKLDWDKTFTNRLRDQAQRVIRMRPKGFTPIIAAQTDVGGFYARLDTAEWDAWNAYYRDEKRKAPPIDGKGGWRFPSRWPPGHGAAA